MEVRPFARKRAALEAVVFTLACVSLFVLPHARLAAAQFETTNFIVTADTEPFARQVAETAENSRRDLAIQWLGVELPAWSQPCPIQVKAGPNLGAGGETSFTFKGNEVFGWKMKIQGTRERIVDSVVPHEVSHMILASYFRQPVPRWIDEGAATSTEAAVERNNYRRMLIDFLGSAKGIPFNKMVNCTEYPSDLLPFYAQGFSVCEYLIMIGGHRRLIEFAKEGMLTGDWSAAIGHYYNFANIDEFQAGWNDWVSTWYRQGMPEQLPQVARIEDYPYDITGRPMAAGGAVMVASVSQLESAIPSRARSGAGRTAGYNSAGGNIVSFEDGVGSATTAAASNNTAANNTIAANNTAGSNNTAALAYQGSYGQLSAPPQPLDLAGGPQAGSAGNAAPEREYHSEPVILGQEPAPKLGGSGAPRAGFNRDGGIIRPPRW
ncbi:MAG: hypothetical protein IKF77_09975 [Thermoguttaceae bacterium]|nr:hypothetical protein [Thermoguttaceae bacterium]